MPTVYHYICTRQNDDGAPASYSCTLELTDDAWIGSSGTWKAAGPSATNIFVVQSGKWVKGPNLITLDSPSGAQSERVVMENANASAGKMKGDGLVGGYIVDWRKT